MIGHEMGHFVLGYKEKVGEYKQYFCPKIKVGILAIFHKIMMYRCGVLQHIKR
jgi:hypothetical protein